MITNNAEFSLLSTKNFNSLQTAIEKLNPNENVSAFYLTLWKHYGYTIYFSIEQDAVYFITKLNINKCCESLSEDLHCNNIHEKWSILKPFVKNDNDILKHFKIAIEKFKKIFPEAKSIFLDRVPPELLESFSDAIVFYTTETAFIYETEQLKFFAGKKMQKKRNLLNFFLKNYAEKSRQVIYDIRYREEVLDFINDHIKKSDPETYRDYEFNAAVDLLYTPDVHLKGSVLFYEEKIIGVTIGIEHGNFFEIFVEKADSFFKGAYQYLLSQNLVLHNINTPYIDRQDSESISGLVQSKKSYKPILIKEGCSIKIPVE